MNLQNTEKYSSSSIKTHRKAWSTTLHHGDEAKKHKSKVAHDGTEHSITDWEV